LRATKNDSKQGYLIGHLHLLVLSKHRLAYVRTYVRSCRRRLVAVVVVVVGGGGNRAISGAAGSTDTPLAIKVAMSSTEHPLHGPRKSSGSSLSASTRARTRKLETIKATRRNLARFVPRRMLASDPFAVGLRRQAIEAENPSSDRAHAKIQAPTATSRAAHGRPRPSPRPPPCHHHCSDRLTARPAAASRGRRLPARTAAPLIVVISGLTSHA